MKRKGPTKIIIAGAAGRDFFNFLTFFKNNPRYKVVAFTAAQIPGISKRSFPKSMAGRLYTKDIPIYDEEQLPKLIKKFKVDEVILAYSDLSREDVMSKASLVLANGADFRLMGPKSTMLESKKPLISICATRTGAGKGTVARKVLRILKKRGYSPVIIRHPMPYSQDLKKQVCQRFASYKDLEKHKTTIEEREEYQPYIDMGFVVYSGIDYEMIIKSAEREGDVIVFESGNNDISFFKSNLYIVVADPLRPTGVFSYPGEANIRMADIVVINKLNVAKRSNVKLCEKNIRMVNRKAKIIKGESHITVDKPELIKGRKCLIIEDSPTVTHGSLGYGVGMLAAEKYKALKNVNPRPYAVGSIKTLLNKYKYLKNILPSAGYGEKQIKDLEKTINSVKCDTVVLGTLCDLTKIIKINKPIVRVSYEIKEIGKKLESVLNFKE